MNLAIDIGNSFTHFAVYKSRKQLYSVKYSSTNKSVVTKYLSLIKKKFKIDCIGIASVNNKAERYLIQTCRKLFKITPITINYKSKLPVKIKIKSPETLGVDRICNAVYAYTYFNNKYNVLIADLGTANTYDIVTKKGEFIGGIIAPGIMTSSKALNINTANLPLLAYGKLSKNAPLLGNNTFEAIQSGLVNYMKSATEGIVQKVKKQFKGNLKVIITGGSSELLLKKVSFKYIHIENTVLEGINIILKYKNTVK